MKDRMTAADLLTTGTRESRYACSSAAGPQFSTFKSQFFLKGVHP